MASLFSISGEIADILENGEHIDTETGEFKDFDDLDAIEMEFDEKVENVVMYIKSIEAEAAAIKAEEASLAERRKSKERKAESLKKYVSRCFDMTGKDKFETARCRLSWRKSQRVEVFDPEALPIEFMRKKTTVEPDKARIKEYLKAHDILPGAAIITSKSLQIK